MSYGREEPHIMTGDEYLVERIHKLEQENEELKNQIEKLANSKRMWFTLDWDKIKGKWQFEYDEKAAVLKYIKIEEGGKDNER